MAKPTGKRKADFTVTDSQQAKRPQPTRFKYEELSTKYIRILQVTCKLKRSGRRSLAARLRSFHVKRAPHFIALSYAWPKAGTPTRTIRCDNQQLTISSHVYTALENLCPPDAAGSFAIWIDAICIDQANNLEKKEQVSHMGSIYGLASQVIVWLGENSLVDSHREKIEDLAVQIGSLSEMPSPDEYSKPPFSEYDNSFWLAVESTLLSSWFRRLWVVQEVCLASIINVLCGRCFIPWASLFILLRFPMTDERLSISNSNDWRDFEGIFICRDRIRVAKNECGGNEFIEVIKCLDILRSQLVSKPIDKVYASMFLLPTSLRNEIVVDYSREEQYWITYVHLARILVTQKGGLIVLSMAASDTRVAELPSWCPDWNVMSQWIELPRPRDHTDSYGSFLYPERRPEIRFPHPRHIQIRGFRIDRIVESVPANIPAVQYETVEFQRAWLTWESECLQKLMRRFEGSMHLGAIISMHLRNLRFNLWQRDDENKELVTISEHDHCQWSDMHSCYRELIAQLENAVNCPSGRRHSLSANSNRFFEMCGGIHLDRSYFITEQGRVGRGSIGERVGDVLVVLDTAPDPFILRYEDGDNVAKWIGDAYLDGCMDLKTMPSKGRGPDEWFTIG